MSERIHADARAFARVADVYERGRPEYPDAMVELLATRLGLAPGRRVLDLAAGTGKLTRRLLETGAEVVAVEPLAELRALLPPQAEVLDGVAEAIPLADASVDTVTVAAAFHWFRPEDALREIHRVLRPGGGLALVGSMRDERDPLEVEIADLLRRLGLTGRRGALEPAAAVVAASGLFEPVEQVVLPHIQELDEDGLVDRFASVSFVAAAPAAVRRELAAALRELVHARGGRVSLPYATDVYLTSSRG